LRHSASRLIAAKMRNIRLGHPVTIPRACIMRAADAAFP